MINIQPSTRLCSRRDDRLTTDALLAAVYTAALAHTLAALSLTLAVPTHHFTWPAGRYMLHAHRKTYKSECDTKGRARNRKLCGSCAHPFCVYDRVFKAYSIEPRPDHLSSLSPHRTLSSEGCSVHLHSETGGDRLERDRQETGIMLLSTQSSPVMFYQKPRIEKNLIFTHFPLERRPGRANRSPCE